MGGKRWTEYEAEIMRKHYANLTMQELIALLGRNDRQIYARAHLMGLKKSPGYLEAEAKRRDERLTESGKKTRFNKGNPSWNAGTSYHAGGRSVDFQFKKGASSIAAAKRLKPLGAERRSKEGFLQRKVTMDGVGYKRWKAVHEILWEEAHGKRPDGYLVAFKDGNRENITIENLELISRAENMRRNSILNRYTPEVIKAIRAVSRVKKKIKEKTNEKSNCSDQ